MKAGALQWFLHDSHTARSLKRLLCGRAFADCPIANAAVTGAIIVGCYAVAMCMAEQW